MRYNVGDIVTIRNYSEDLNGEYGVIVSINGEYHNVAYIKDGDINQVEVYRNELTRISEVPTVDLTQEHFDKELFKI